MYRLRTLLVLVGLMAGLLLMPAVCTASTTWDTYY
jgi:hypothetical protein